MAQRVEWVCEKCRSAYFSGWFHPESLGFQVLSDFKAKHKCKEVKDVDKTR